MTCSLAMPVISASTFTKCFSRERGESERGRVRKRDRKRERERVRERMSDNIKQHTASHSLPPPSFSPPFPSPSAASRTLEGSVRLLRTTPETSYTPPPSPPATASRNLLYICTPIREVFNHSATLVIYIYIYNMVYAATLRPYKSYSFKKK